MFMIHDLQDEANGPRCLSVQTEPISPAGGRPRGPGCPTIPVFYHSTILRQTTPISRRAEGRTSAVWIRSCDEWDTGEAVRKQSQFPGAGHRGGVSIADWGWRRIGSPACPLLPLACMGRLCKQTQFRRVATGIAVQTNPICAEAISRVNAVRTRSWDKLLPEWPRKNKAKWQSGEAGGRGEQGVGQSRPGRPWYSWALAPMLLTGRMPVLRNTLRRHYGQDFYAKQDAHNKSPRVGFRPAFLGRYRGSGRLAATFVGRVKQTQFRRERFAGQVLCRQGVAMHQARGEPPQNKANFPKRGTGRCLHCGLGTEPHRIACLGPTAAGLRGLVVQTNPISATVPIRRSAVPGANCATTPRCPVSFRQQTQSAGRGRD